jgi:hypothetical protein
MRRLASVVKAMALRARVVIGRGRIAAIEWIGRSATDVAVVAAVSAAADGAVIARTSGIVRRVANVPSAAIVIRAATEVTEATARTTSPAIKVRRSSWWWTGNPAAGLTRRAIPASSVAPSTAI